VNCPGKRTPAREERILVISDVAFLGFEERTATEEGHAHACFDLFVGVTLAQIHFKRSVRKKNHVTCDEFVLYAIFENIGKRPKFERLINATTRTHTFDALKVTRVRLLAAFFGHDEIAQTLSARAGCDFERRVAADGAQRELREIVLGEHFRDVRHGVRLRREERVRLVGRVVLDR